MSDVSIQNKTTRSKLPARPEPHWRLIESGFHIGYRKMDSGTETWVARFSNRWGVTGKNGKTVRYVFHPCGALTPSNSFDVAVKSARVEIARLDDTGQSARAARVEAERKAITIEAACRGYIDAVRKTKHESREHSLG